MSVPEWLALKLDKWGAERLTGEFKLTFRHGVVQHYSEDVKGVPPAAGQPGGLGCPRCHRPFDGERDYGNILSCSHCDKEWSRFDLAKQAAGSG